MCIRDSLATTAAAEQRIVPPHRPPHLLGRHEPPAYAADPPLAGSRAGEGRGHPGRPESPGLVPDVPRPDAEMELPEFAGLRDVLAQMPEEMAHEMPRYPDEPSEYLPWFDFHHKPDPDADSSRAPDDAAGPPDHGKSPPDTPKAKKGPHKKPRGTGPEAPPGRAPAHSRPRKSPSSRPDVADRLDRHPYKPLRPSAPPKQQPHTPSDGAEPAASTGPYAMETPSAPVERVLPMGAGLALTGLGLSRYAAADVGTRCFT